MQHLPVQQSVPVQPGLQELQIFGEAQPVQLASQVPEQLAVKKLNLQ